MNNPGSVVFQEIQKFRQWWFLFLVGVLIVFSWYGVIQQYIFQIPFGNNPASDFALIGIGIVSGILVPFLLLSLKLETSICQDGIRVRFFPFHFKPQTFLYKDIKEYKFVTYHPIREYGGWGIRWGVNGKAYNVSGNKGLQLEFTNGKKLLIGSNHPEKLEKYIQIWKKQNG